MIILPVKNSISNIIYGLALFKQFDYLNNSHLFKEINGYGYACTHQTDTF